jgi:hypothetical protein
MSFVRVRLTWCPRILVEILQAWNRGWNISTMKYSTAIVVKLLWSGCKNTHIARRQCRVFGNRSRSWSRNTQTPVVSGRHGRWWFGWWQRRSSWSCWRGRWFVAEKITSYTGNGRWNTFSSWAADNAITTVVARTANFANTNGHWRWCTRLWMTISLIRCSSWNSHHTHCVRLCHVDGS